MNDIERKIIRGFLKTSNQPRLAADITANLDLPAKAAVMVLREMTINHYLIGEATTMTGYYTLTEIGILAASEPTNVDFEEITKRLGEVKRVPKRVSGSLSAETVVIGDKIELPCGCIAYRLDPPSTDPGFRFLACSDQHEQIIKS